MTTEARFSEVLTAVREYAAGEEQYAIEADGVIN
jgi:hypothetical protein